MALYKATIEVLIEAKSSDEASDAISEALSTNLLQDPRSGWKDWHYCRMHDGEFQRDPGPKEISSKEACNQFDDFARRRKAE